MNRTFSKLFALFLVIILSGAGCGTSKPAASNLALARPVTLKYWRPFDGNDAFDQIIQKYRALHPQVTIEYRRLRPETYEQELVNAFAEDRGPDLFAVPNSSLRGYLPKITPMPKAYKMANIVSKGGLSGETAIEIVDKKGLTPRQIQNNFLDVVVNDVVLPKNGSGSLGNVATDDVYGLPLSVDTMMMFYNKDILNTEGVATVPAKWTEFQEVIQKVTKIDTNLKLVRPGAVIGTASNVPRSSDLLALLMMQSGTQMTDDYGNIAFHTLPPNFTRPTPPGIDALRFYTEFAIPQRKVYTWNALQPDGLEAFIQGRVAFLFGYSYQLPLIRARAPKLNLGIAPVPQQTPTQPVNIANYWVETVSKKSVNKDAAWDFLLFATNIDNVKSYLTATQKPTALRTYVSVQKDDVVLGPFADQLLTAKSWYRGKDGLAADKVMGEIITDTLAAITSGNNEAFTKAISNGVSKLNQTIQ